MFIATGAQQNFLAPLGATRRAPSGAPDGCRSSGSINISLLTEGGKGELSFWTRLNFGTSRISSEVPSES